MNGNNTSVKSSYLVRPASWNPDECDTVIAPSARQAAEQWRRKQPSFAGQRVLVWYWSQNEMQDRPAYVSEARGGHR